MLTKVHIIKVVVFPVVMYRCEKWTIKKAEHQRIDSFDLQCWRTLERPLDSMELKPVNPKGNQPWIFLRKTDDEDESSVLWPPEAKSWLIGKDPDAGKDWGQEEKGLDGIPDSVHMSVSSSGRLWRTGKPGVLQSLGLQRVRHDWATEQQRQHGRC